MIALNIRPAEKSDLPALLLLFAQPDFDNGVVLALKDAEAIFDKYFDYPDYTLYVAELDGIVVGTFSLLVMDNFGHMGARSGVVEGVVVSTHYQGHGIGKKMMAFALEAAAEKGCYKMALSSNVKRKAAHAFYEGLGFDRYGYAFSTSLGDKESN